ncbi:MAG: rhodanese-related sulfurtransferase [Pseudomonadota bacterium]
MATPVHIATFYRFVRLEDHASLRPLLLEWCDAHNITGTVLLASEGINATLAGERSCLEQLLGEYLGQDSRLAGLQARWSTAAQSPFRKMKVKLRREIVTLGVPGLDPGERTGRHVPPSEWNEVLRDPHTLVVDTRNVYETGIGSFTGAEDPKTTNFREFPDYVRERLDPSQHRRVAMFCTGGIRCEKASALLLEAGFDDVCQLEGGILAYLQTVPEAQSLWWGECFVFDDRVAVDPFLAPGSYGQCYACRRPVNDEDRADERYEAGISCPACFDTLTDDQRASFTERRRQRALAQARAQREQDR